MLIYIIYIWTDWTDVNLRMMKDLEGKIKEYQGRYDTLVSAQADALMISQLVNKQIWMIWNELTQTLLNDYYHIDCWLGSPFAFHRSIVCFESDPWLRGSTFNGDVRCKLASCQKSTFYGDVRSKLASCQKSDCGLSSIMTRARHGIFNVWYGQFPRNSEHDLWTNPTIPYTFLAAL